MRPAAQVRQLSSFVKFIETKWRPFEEILFRGQAEPWPLLPKIARLKLRGGLSVPEAEKRMMSAFRTRSLPLLDSRPENEWEWLSVAQHHGLATRLLDWSTNPLAALWFAVERPASTGVSGVIWAFTPKQEDYIDDFGPVSPYQTKKTLVFRPKHIIRRIVAQHGCFTVHSFSTRENKVVPLEKIKRYKGQLEHYVVPADSFASLRHDLDRCGINGATLFGDLGGLCRNTEWQHSLLDDELDGI